MAEYTITITKVEKAMKMETPPYQKIGTKEVARNPDFLSGSSPEKSRIEDVLGYPPAREVECEVITRVYEQRLPSLDMSAVLLAVNGISIEKPEN